MKPVGFKRLMEWCTAEDKISQHTINKWTSDVT